MVQWQLIRNNKSFNVRQNISQRKTDNGFPKTFFTPSTDKGCCYSCIGVAIEQLYMYFKYN